MAVIVTFAIERKVKPLTTLNTLTNDQTLIAAEKIKLASGDIDSVFLAVEFDAAWDEFVNRSASFYTSFNSNVEEVLLTDDKCTVPSKMLEQEGTLFIGVIGVSADGKRVKTSTYAKYTLIKGAEHAFTTIKPTLDLYQQYLIAVDEKTAPIITALQANFEKKYTDLLQAMTGDVLWTNPDSSLDFEEQSIALNLAEYKRIQIVFKHTIRNYDGGGAYFETEASHKNQEYHQTCQRFGSGGTYFFARKYEFNDNEVKFYNATSGSDVENHYIVPVEIRAYKY